MQLVIVESPTKARTLSRFLGKDYQIEASMGHIRDLPKSTLGVAIKENFEPEYAIVEGKKTVIQNLKSKAKDADTIILATDPDREGEAIAWHVKELIADGKSHTVDKKSKNHKPYAISHKPIQRIVFHEITKEAIEQALQHPREIDLHLVDAQTARRVLDRLVGYKLSPLLWQKVRRGLSAGRVQSVAVRLIVEREREIEKFTKKPYFTITAFLARGPVGRIPRPMSSVGNLPAGTRRGSPAPATPRLDFSVAFELFEIDGEKIEEKEMFTLYDGEYVVTKTIIDTKEKADTILSSALAGKLFTVVDVLQKETKRSPYPPFTTSTLAQEASRRLGFSSKRTMSLAQKLYEEGYITYHRTDSVAMAKPAVFALRNFIEREYGRTYVNNSPRIYKAKQKLAQEAHEAIRPTAVGQISNLKSQISNLGNDYFRLYELIWKRAVACQMADAILESTTVFADARGPVGRIPRPMSSVDELPAGTRRGSPAPATPRLENIYRFKANGSVVVFDGFLKLYPHALSEQRLPMYLQGETLEAEKIQAIAHETPPPPRYNEASLIQTLEEKAIGRPSTYAPIISTIEIRRYVERSEGKFIPTSVGIAVNDFLVTNFTQVVDVPFTAEMEHKLDQIANGNREWQGVMGDFYTPFEKKLKEVEGSARVKIEVEQTDEKCPTCGSNLVIRVGRFGKFLACSTFPKCKYTKSFAQDTGISCPLDGGAVILKKTRKGRKFYGCSNYPTCKFAAWRLEDIHKTVKVKT